MSTTSHLIVCTLIFLVTGCSHTSPTADLRRECPFMGGVNKTTGEKFDPESVTRPSTTPVVKVVELNDDGEIVDRCQWADALYASGQHILRRG